MIRVAIDDFTVDVPIERRMTVDDFLAVADKLERLAGRAHPEFIGHAHQAPAMAHGYEHQEAWQPPAPTAHAHGHSFSFPPEVDHEHAAAHAHATPAELRFDHEEVERLEFFMERLARQLAKLEETHLRLERLERMMAEHHASTHH